MRLKSGIWVAAYLRRFSVEGAFAAVRRRGADEAGAIFIKVNRLDGTADLYGPAPQTAFADAHPFDRAFSPALRSLPAAEAEVEAYLAHDDPACREFSRHTEVCNTRTLCVHPHLRTAQGNSLHYRHSHTESASKCHKVTTGRHVHESTAPG